MERSRRSTCPTGGGPLDRAVSLPFPGHPNGGGPAPSSSPGRDCGREAGQRTQKNNSPRGRASLAEDGGALASGGRGAALHGAGPWRSSHTPHPGRVARPVRTALPAAPPQSPPGPTSCGRRRRAANSTHSPAAFTTARALPVP